MVKIVVADKMEAEALERMKALGQVVYQPADLKKELADANFLVVRSATKVKADIAEAMGPQMKMVIRGGVGTDNIDKDYCKQRGIEVRNTPSASSNAVAELAIGLIFSAVRHIPGAHEHMKKKIWKKKELSGREIMGKTLGIIGYGRIGRLLASKAHGLGMSVIAYDRGEVEAPARKVDLDTLYREADVISLHLPSTPETIGMINKDSIAKMKDKVCIVNTARGDLINEDDLYEACKSGKVAIAALDVYPKEPYEGRLLDLNNVYFTCHLGASTIEAQERIGQEVYEIIKSALGK